MATFGYLSVQDHPGGGCAEGEMRRARGCHGIGALGRAGFRVHIYGEIFMRFIVFSILVMVANFSYADPWSGWTKVSYIYPYSAGLNIITQYKNTELSSCDNGGRFFLPKTNANYQVLSSAIIAAFIAGKEINFNIDGEGITQPTCSPTLNRLMVR